MARVIRKQALVSTRNIKVRLPTEAMPKLMPTYLCCVIVIERVGPIACCLDLEDTGLSACHNVLDVSRFHPHRFDGSMQSSNTKHAFELEDAPHWQVK